MNIIEYARLFMNQMGLVLTTWHIDMIEHLQSGGGFLIDQSTFKQVQLLFRIYNSWIYEDICFNPTPKVQQVFREGVLPGHHFHTDIDFLDKNISNVIYQMERIKAGEHELMQKYIGDIYYDSLKENLMSQYKNDFRTYLINIVNLQNSEN